MYTSHRRQMVYPTPPTSCFETELESPLEEYQDEEEYDYPVSPTDPTMDESHTNPTPPGNGGIGASVSRAPSNSSFFNSVFLDTPDRHLTRPLKVKKRAAPVGPPRMRRRSNHSLPRSPISPMHSTYLHIPPSPRRLVRDNSTASSAHRAITDSFFAMDSPALSTPSPLPPLPSLSISTSTGSSDRATSTSPIHLGLGHIGTQSYADAILPGPSPPASPPTTPSLSSSAILLTQETPSPILLTPPPRRTGAGSSNPIRAPPITPTNAPSKAARLLGTNSPLPSALKPSPNHKSVGLATLLRGGSPSAPRRPEHFRALPNSTLSDIQRFFGDVPKKSGSAIGARKGPPRTHEGRAKNTAASTALQGRDKALPTIGAENRGGEYESGEGRMWLDVEEEQEFAWLMSDLKVDLAQVGQTAKVERVAGLGSGASEDGWGMEDFKCILDMRPAVEKKGTKAEMKFKKKKEKEKGGRKVFESFLDLGLGDGDGPTEEETTPIEEVRIKPSTNRSISNPTLASVIETTPTRPSRSRLPPHLSSQNRSVSAPDTAAATTTTTTASHSTLIPKASSSPSPLRPKHRPPPLDLRFLPPVRNLPTIITSLSPSLLTSRNSISTSTPTPRAGSGSTLLPSLPILTPRTYAHTHVYSKSVDSPGLPPLLPGRPIPADIPSFPSPLFVSYGRPLQSYTDSELLRKKEEVVMILPPRSTADQGVPPPRTPFKHPRRAPLPGATYEGGTRREEEVTRVGVPIYEQYQRYQKPAEMAYEGLREYGMGRQEGQEQVSVFDPPSPTVMTSGMGAKAWFRKRVGRM